MEAFCIFLLKNYLLASFGYICFDIVTLIINFFYEKTKIKVSCGATSTKFLIDGIIYTCGSNYKGSLGLSLTESKNVPFLYSMNLKNIKKIRSGAYHTLVLSKNGKLYGWGVNRSGQLGISKHRHVDHPISLNCSNIKKISCGNHYSIIMDNENQIYVCGANCSGQLGIGEKYAGHKKSIGYFKKMKLPNINKIVCGSYHTLSLTICGKIYAWGDNEFGQLGLGNTKNYYEPAQLFLSDIIKIKCAYLHTIALSKYNTVYTWGDNRSGELGLGLCDVKIISSPSKVDLYDIISIACGDHFNFAMNKYGDIYGWGENRSGILGLGKKSAKICRSPCKISLSKIMNVICGSDHTIAVDINKKVYVWGTNEEGQLGLTDYDTRYDPHQINISKEIEMINRFKLYEQIK